MQYITIGVAYPILMNAMHKTYYTETGLNSLGRL